MNTVVFSVIQRMRSLSIFFPPSFCFGLMDFFGISSSHFRGSSDDSVGLQGSAYPSSWRSLFAYAGQFGLPKMTVSSEIYII
jgi:hypothetical protein